MGIHSKQWVRRPTPVQESGSTYTPLVVSYSTSVGTAFRWRILVATVLFAKRYHDTRMLEPVKSLQLARHIRNNTGVNVPPTV